MIFQSSKRFRPAVKTHKSSDQLIRGKRGEKTQSEKWQWETMICI